MAKAKTLAALAGLAGLAYAYNKNKNKDDSSTTDSKSGETTSSKKDAEDNDTLARVNKNMSPGQSAVDDTKAGVLKALGAPKTASNAQAGNQGVVPSKTVTPKAPPKPTVAKQAPSDPRLAETGTSRGRPAEAKNPNYSNEGRNSVAPTTTSKVGDAVKTVAKTVAQGPAGVMATTAKPVADKATNAMRETYRDFSGKIQYKTPDIPSAAKTASDAVGDALSKPFRAIREAGNRGNPDVKMASGGMTASRRGDGIAQRGKTRGKMC